jgi:hypothetical protein
MTRGVRAAMRGVHAPLGIATFKTTTSDLLLFKGVTNRQGMQSSS